MTWSVHGCVSVGGREYGSWTAADMRFAAVPMCMQRWAGGGSRPAVTETQSGEDEGAVDCRYRVWGASIDGRWIVM